MYDIHAISALTDGPDGEACNVVGLFILCVCVCVRVAAVAIILSQHSVHSAVCTIQCILGRQQNDYTVDTVDTKRLHIVHVQ